MGTTITSCRKAGHSLSTKPPSTPAEALERPISDVAANLESLRDFVDVLDTHLTATFRELLTVHKDALGPVLLALEKASRLFPELGISEVPDEQLRNLRANYPAHEEIKVERGQGSSITIKMAVPAGKDVGLAVRETLKSTKRTKMLYSSSLMNLASSVELFFSTLLHQYFQLHPEAVGVKDKVFSFEDLSGFDSIADARAHYVLSKIEELLRGSLADWLTFLRERVKLSMGYLKQDTTALEETFQRRNVIVHNGGIANSIYLAKVAPEERLGIERGTDLVPSREYLNARIDLWEKVCILIAAELWKQLAPDDAQRASLLADISYRHLLGNRWSISEALSRFTLADKQMSESSHTTAQLNYWQCLKWTGRWDAIRAEVEAADYSAKGLRYQLGLLALQDRSDDFFRLLPNALKAEELTVDQLREFPIFRRMREDSRCAAFRDSAPREEGQQPVNESHEHDSADQREP